MAEGAEVRVAVVGCGDVAHRAYAPSLAAEPRVRLVAAVDRDLGRARSFAAAAGAPDAECADELATVLRADGEDALINLTPPSSHAQLTRLALSSGRHVLTEKPLATDLAEAIALRDLAIDAGLQLVTAPAIMATPRFRRLREMVAEGQLGTPLYATSSIQSLGPMGMGDYSGDPRAFYSAAVGPAVDLGLYALHALTGVLGPVRSVRAWERTNDDARRARERAWSLPVECPDMVTMELEFVTGAVGVVLAGFAANASKAPFLEIHGSQRTVTIASDRWLDPTAPLMLTGDTRWETVPVAGTARTRGGNLLHTGVTELVDCLADGRPTDLSSTHACHCLAIVRAASEAARSGRAIVVQPSSADAEPSDPSHASAPVTTWEFENPPM